MKCVLLSLSALVGSSYGSKLFSSESDTSTEIFDAHTRKLLGCNCPSSAGFHPTWRPPTKSWNGYEYLYSKAGIPWCQHQACAEIWGGNLASIESNEENQFIFKKIIGKEERPGCRYAGAVWIGGYGRKLVDGSKEYKWRDNASWNFEKWPAAHPRKKNLKISSTKVAMLHCSPWWKEFKNNVTWNKAVYKRLKKQ
mmetsp:Transcript_26944/g.53812  ORF Transcript_26944/g.53812 Transcript_26944/m.53812 type:complete len:196 (+) Transcript_26944:159-746(+)